VEDDQMISSSWEHFVSYGSVLSLLTVPAVRGGFGLINTRDFQARLGYKGY
jgi:hypothetical protein